MSLLLPLAAALAFTCERPTHHDGDAIRCAGMEQSMRLYGVDAPEMPGSCRPGRKCTPGDPYAARDHLRALTDGRTVVCDEKDIDSYGRPVVRCTADGADLGCAMVAAGHAVERYGRLDCDAPAPEAVSETTIVPVATAAPPPAAPIIRRSKTGEPRYFAPPDAPPVSRAVSIGWFLAGTWLILFNIIGWSAMDIDKSRATGTIWDQK
ncbi:thermonuclease family protein, partial [Polymorphobacter sp.]|uniref:thermonuclease family protein n=1 Tax=Polymorphobacter sp. TaxID=1909290 RepID=UPI003F6FD21C